MKRTSWKAVAEALAERVANYADIANCGHVVLEPECAFCQDRAVYQIYLDRRAQDLATSR